MNKNMIYVYIIGFTLITLLGLYYYKDIIFKPSPATDVTVTEINNPQTNQKVRKFNVQGMYCDACKKKIESAVLNIDGVLKVSVNQESNEMIVTYKPQMEKIKETLSAVNDLGYTAGLKSSSGKLQVLDFNVTFQ